MKHSRFLPLFVILVFASAAQAGTLLSEGFNDILALPGWVLTNNNSNPLGTTNWFQGNPGIFPAQAGAADSYIAANFLNAAAGGNISNWLISPELSLGGSVNLSFFTRSSGVFADRLEVRLSTNGSSTDVGATDSSVGDFGQLLMTINPALNVPGYPDYWAQFTVGITGLPGTATGRFAFRYFVSDTNVNADYIGIDSVEVSARASAVPEPATLALVGSGIAILAIWRRRFLS